MSDYKGIFSAHNPDYSLGIYQVNIVKRSNPAAVVWSGEVEAASAKKAQEKWRKEYADVRARHDHSYALIIKQLRSL